MVDDTTAAAAFTQLRACGWTVVESVGFTDGYDVDLPAVRSFAARFGTPSSRDGGADIWPVRPTSAASSETFSRRTGAASMHTDAAYRADPEPLVALFSVRPARDGGVSRLLEAGAAVADLDADTRESLREPVWRWAPPEVFGGDPAAARSVLAPDDTIRWRYDNLIADPEHMRAARRFRDHVERHSALVEAGLPTDSVLICDNRRTLHGRTAFNDRNRLLLRVRLVTP